MSNEVWTLSSSKRNPVLRTRKNLSSTLGSVHLKWVLIQFIIVVTIVECLGHGKPSERGADERTQNSADVVVDNHWPSELNNRRVGKNGHDDHNGDHNHGHVPTALGDLTDELNSNDDDERYN